MRIRYRTVFRSTFIVATNIIITKGSYHSQSLLVPVPVVALRNIHRYHHCKAVNRYNRLLPTSSMTSISTTIESKHHSDDKATYQWEDYKDEVIRKCILPLSYDTHKGISGGRIGIIGGNELYVGAPYFTGMAALHTGADLVSIYTSKEASIPLKCYSPDFMVQPIYSATELEPYNNNINNNDNDDMEDFSILKDVVTNMELYIQQRRFHCIIIGPGMGRHPVILATFAEIIKCIIQRNLYIVLDADALYLLSLPQYCTILQGYTKAIITPNKVEYERIMSRYHTTLTSTKEDMLQNVIVVQKGYIDTIWYNHQIVFKCHEIGGMKRCGGIGDVLAGTMGTLIAWQSIMSSTTRSDKDTNPTTTTNNNNDNDINVNVNVPLTCYMACCLIKRATKNAFDMKRRAMSAQDIIDQIGITYEAMIHSKYY
jgi:ATP-dependent NAD(P)H-hydrate dehydratase